MKKINVVDFRKEIEMEDKEQLLKDLETCRAIYTMHKNVGNLDFDMKSLIKNDKLVGRLEIYRHAKVDINEILDTLTDLIIGLTSKSNEPFFNDKTITDEDLANSVPLNIQELEVSTPQVNPEIKYLFDKGIEYFKKVGENIIDRAFDNACNSYMPIYSGFDIYQFRNLYEAVANTFSLEKCEITYNDDMSILSITTLDSEEYKEVIDSYYNEDLEDRGFGVPPSGYARVTQYLDKNNQYLPYREVYTSNVKLYKDQRVSIIKIIYYNNQIEKKKMHAHDFRNMPGSTFSTKIRFSDYRSEEFDVIHYTMDRNTVNFIQYIKDDTVKLQITNYNSNLKVGFYNKNNEGESKNGTVDWFEPATLLKMYNVLYGDNGMSQAEIKKVLEKLEDSSTYPTV